MSAETLLKVLDNNKSDKGVSTKGHHYHLVYGPDFGLVQDKPINILEVGIFKGTSHQTWIDFFPNAQVYGIDVFTRLKPKDVPVLEDPRCHYITADSTKSNLGDLVKEAFGEDIKFDIIIDDGLHTPDANKKTFENLMPFLKDDGYFYIEDIWPIDILTVGEAKYPFFNRPENKPKYTQEEYAKFLEALNVYPSVTHYDYRVPSRLPDSYVIKIGK
tara:strand:- start:904 stop:1551 length:648 start_codon:yes stop_codon:yes gene_type:complete